MKTKEIKIILRVVLGIFGIVTITKLMPYFTKMLSALILLYEMTDTSPEFKMILLLTSLWISCSVINVIVNIIFKIQLLINNKLQKGE